MEGCIHGGSIVEIGSCSRWLLSELFSFIIAQIIAPWDNVSPSSKLRIIDVQKCVDLDRIHELVSFTLKEQKKETFDERDIQNVLEAVKFTKCESIVHVICALRKFQEELKSLEAPKDQHFILVLEGLSNLYWGNRVMTAGRTMVVGKEKKGPDLFPVLIKLIQEMSASFGVTFIVSKLVFFQKSKLDYFGANWASIVTSRFLIEEAPPTNLTLGKTCQSQIVLSDITKEGDIKYAKIMINERGCK